MDVRDQLPVGCYTVCKNPLTGEYFLEEGEQFTLPKKLYGKTERHSARVLQTFENRQQGTQVGVFLSGTKGSGKTLLAKHISQKSGLPVIVVNAAYTDDRFMRTMQGIEQEAVILFDEFEKTYNEEDQEAILTLFDGVYTVRDKLMIITCNDKYAVKSFFHNRPSRLRYAIDFTSLEREFVEEYCADRLDDKRYTDKITLLCSVCDEFNFDMLQTLVDELNRYGGDFEETLDILNVKPATGSRMKWVVKVETPDNRGVTWKIKYGGVLSRSPLLSLQDGRHGNGCIELGVAAIATKHLMSATTRGRSENTAFDDELEDLDGDSIDLMIRNEHLYKVDPVTGSLVFKITDSGNNFVVTITEDHPTGNRWGNFFDRDSF
jgi:hypothetical protein